MLWAFLGYLPEFDLNLKTTLWMTYWMKPVNEKVLVARLQSVFHFVAIFWDGEKCLTMYLTNIKEDARIFFYISLVLTKHMFKNYICFYLFKGSECCEFYNDNEKMTVLCKNAASYPIFPWKLKDLKQFSRSSGTKK